MRNIAYALCFFLIGVPSLHGLLASLLALVQVSLPYPPFLTVLFSFGSLVPPMFAYALPRAVLIVLGYAMVFLVLRRAWLFLAKKERTPASFVGFQKILGYIAFYSFSLGLLVLVLSMLFRAGSGVPAGMLMIPAMICAPWAFFLTEVVSFKQPGAAPSARLAKSTSPPEPADAAAIASALKKFRSGTSISEVCPACGTLLMVKPAKQKPGRDIGALRLSCECGASNGTYAFD